MGRGSSGNSSSQMNVDWDKWGKVLGNGEWIPITEMGEDGIPVVIGHIHDELRFDYELDEHKITKAEIMDEISGWKNDDGTYGDEDTSIFIAYDDGTFFANDMKPGGKYRDKLKKTGVIGATISTGDFEMVWGGERDRAGNIQPYTTWVSPYDEAEGRTGKSNSYSGYKAVSQWRERVRTVYNHKLPNGRVVPKHETIRRSKRRKVDW